MRHDLDELDIEQQAHMLQVIGRLMTEMYRSGKTKVPEDGHFETLREYAAHLAFQGLEKYGYPSDQPFIATGPEIFEDGSCYGEGRL